MVLVICPVVLLLCAVVMMIGLLLLFLALRVLGCRHHPLLQRSLLLSLIRLPVVGM